MDPYLLANGKEARDTVRTLLLFVHVLKIGVSLTNSMLESA
jgi:hypothetical protein